MSNCCNIPPLLPSIECCKNDYVGSDSVKISITDSGLLEIENYGIFQVLEEKGNLLYLKRISYNKYLDGQLLTLEINGKNLTMKVI